MDACRPCPRTTRGRRRTLKNADSFAYFAWIRASCCKKIKKRLNGFFEGFFFFIVNFRQVRITFKTRFNELLKRVLKVIRKIIILSLVSIRGKKEAFLSWNTLHCRAGVGREGQMSTVSPRQETEKNVKSPYRHQITGKIFPDTFFFFWQSRDWSNNYWCLSLHFFLSPIFLFHSQYVFIPVSSITHFKSEVQSLALPGFPFIFPSIIAIIRELFLIRCPIHTFLLNLSLFHIDFWVFIHLKHFFFIYSLGGILTRRDSHL